MKFAYYTEMIRNYHDMLEHGYSELDTLYTLALLFPKEVELLLTQGYFQVINN
jgi:hypothetical protein